MAFIRFFWTDDNIQHLAENDVTPEEFKQVVSNPDGVGISRTSGDPTAFGYTDAGRFLVCVFEWLDADTVMAVTAFEPDEE